MGKGGTRGAIPGSRSGVVYFVENGGKSILGEREKKGVEVGR